MTTERDVLRDLERALDIAPSPGFEARVRARVGREPRRVARWTWVLTGAAIAATVVLAVMLVPERHLQVQRDVVATDARDNAAAVARGAAPASPPREAPAEPAEASRPPAVAIPTATAARPRSDGAVTPRRSPEVVIPEGQMAAIRRLAAEAAAGRIVMGPERVATSAVLQITALDTAPPIEFDTIRFTPLSASDSPNLWR